MDMKIIYDNYFSFETKTEHLLEAYETDKNDFYSVYNKVKKENKPIYILMSAILIKNKDEKYEGYEECLKELLNIIYEVSSSEERDKSSELTEIIKKTGEIKYIIMSVLSMYDYNNGVKDFIEHIIKNKNYTIFYNIYTIKHIRILINFLPIMRKYISNIDYIDTIQLVIDKGITIKDLLLNYFLYRHIDDKYITKEIYSHFIKQNEKETAECFNDKDYVQHLVDDIEYAILIIDLIYKNANIKNFYPIYQLLNLKSKKIINACLEILEKNEDSTREYLVNNLDNYKENVKENIVSLIKKWDEEKTEMSDFKNIEEINNFVESKYEKSLEKNIKWIDDSLISNVKISGSNVPIKVMKYILMEYMALKEPYRIESIDKMSVLFDKKSFTDTLESLYQTWFDAGAEIKKKNIMIPYCLYGTELQLVKLNKQIEVWAKNARGALGAYIVSAIAMNGAPFALMLVDSIANKFPNAQVKRAASESFAIAAKALNVPVDVLGDKIVPNLGFDNKGNKKIDFGSRTFTLKLMPDFSVEITDDEKEKTIKTLPKPNANDDEKKAEDAKNELTSLKKSIKTVVSLQTTRLQKVLMNGRKWNSSSWKELFVDNPIMNAFAINMIWGAYDDKNNLIKSFRYMEDGTFNTVDEEEYSIPENTKITLVHVSDLDEQTIAKWKQQLIDYEIKQPINQINENIFNISQKDIKDNMITIFDKKTVTVSVINSIAKKLDMQRGGVWDAGGFWDYYLEDEYTNIGCEINFEGAYIGIDYAETLTFGTVIFYDIKKVGAPLKTLYVETEKFAKTAGVNPLTLPKRFTSSILKVIDSYVNKE